MRLCLIFFNVKRTSLFFRPSAAVGDVKMDIARVLQATDIEQNEDPTRPRGHVTILPETCQITLQALRNKYEVLSQVRSPKVRFKRVLFDYYYF